jgi:hypothetical protein
MLIKYKKSKFTKFDWQILRKHLEGYIGNISHECGKNYEYLCFLRIVSVNEHFICADRKTYGHKKCMYPENYPISDRDKNLAQWKAILGDDYNYFVAEGLADIV